jgi:hypothetical protein
MRATRPALLLLLGTASATIVHSSRPPARPAPSQLAPLLQRLGLVPREWDVRAGERYSSQDWLTNLLSVPRSLTLKRIQGHLLANVLITAAVVGLRSTRGVRLAMPALPHQLTGSFLGLLLVFRTNAAYSRFWEARLLWGTVTAAVRKLCVTILCQVQHSEPSRAAHLLACLKAFPLALARTCTGSTEPLPPSLSVLLPAGTPCEAAAVTLCLQL